MKYIIIVTILCSSFLSYGQVEAPNLYCISYDTLNWEIPTVSCGPIEGYVVYVSNDYNGPYTILDTITDVSSIQVIYDNAAGNLRYYFMKTIADCPSETFLNSDTLDNRIPPPVSIDFVSVEATGVRIQWTIPQSTEELLYRIYRVTANGTINIGEIAGTNTFLDVNATADEQIEYYYVVAVDKCNNQGLYDVNHQSIFIDSYLIEECQRNININFSPYLAWGAELDEYRIMVSENGGPFTQVNTTTTTESFVPNILDAINYQIRVDALHSNGSWVASSQTIEVTTDIAQPLTDYNIINATFSPDNSGFVTVIWEWNSDAILSDASITHGSGSVQTDPVLFTAPLTQINTHISSTSYSSLSAISGSATDSCGNILSDEFKLITLSGNYLDKETIKLEWSGFQWSDSSAFDRYMLTVMDENFVELESIDVGKLESYSYLSSSQSGEKLCFKVEGIYDYESMLSPVPATYASQSNIICVIPEIVLHFPNAMTPSSGNRIFKPKGLFLNNIENYHLRIFTRDGKEVFHSQDIDEGWNGTINGNKAASGVYAYRASFVEGNQTEEYSGVLTVIY